MRFSFLCSFYLSVNDVCSVRKTPDWPLCVFIACCIIYCGIGVIWHFCLLCLRYVYSNVELFRGKHKKTQHRNIFLLLLINSYFYSKILKKLGQKAILCTEEEILVTFLPFE